MHQQHFHWILIIFPLRLKASSRISGIFVFKLNTVVPEHNWTIQHHWAKSKPISLQIFHPSAWFLSHAQGQCPRSQSARTTPAAGTAPPRTKPCLNLAKKDYLGKRSCLQVGLPAFPQQQGRWALITAATFGRGVSPQGTCCMRSWAKRLCQSREASTGTPMQRPLTEEISGIRASISAPNEKM